MLFILALELLIDDIRVTEMLLFNIYLPFPCNVLIMDFKVCFLDWYTFCSTIFVCVSVCMYMCVSAHVIWFALSLSKIIFPEIFWWKDKIRRK